MSRGRMRGTGFLLAAEILLASLAVAGCGSDAHGSPATQKSPTATEIGYSLGLNARPSRSYGIRPDGSQLRVLSSGLPVGVGQSRPVTGPIVVSPDGSHEAYWRDADEYSNGENLSYVGVWTARSDGSDAHQIWHGVTFQPSRSYATSPMPRWNRAGTELAIAVGVACCYTDYSIVVMRADGTGAHYLVDSRGQRLTTLSPGALTWSPDGKNLALFEATGTIAIVPAVGGPIRSLGGGREALFFSLSWSPDGQHILASVGITDVGPRIESFAVRGGTPSVVYTPPGIFATAVCYSPDGKQIAIVGSDLRVANVDGTGVRAVPDTAGLGSGGDVVPAISWSSVPAS